MVTKERHAQQRMHAKENARPPTRRRTSCQPKHALADATTDANGKQALANATRQTCAHQCDNGLQMVNIQMQKTDAKRVNMRPPVRRWKHGGWAIADAASVDRRALGAVLRRHGDCTTRSNPRHTGFSSALDCFDICHGLRNLRCVAKVIRCTRFAQPARPRQAPVSFGCTIIK